MIIRMFEYDVQLALENKEMTADTLTVRFPDSAIVSLRHSKKYSGSNDCKSTDPRRQNFLHRSGIKGKALHYKRTV